MLRPMPRRRPNCEQILERKNSWALNEKELEKELEINDELKRELFPKLDDENQIVFSILKSKLYEINDSKSKRVHNYVIN
jgi:hypothetical protein